MINMGFKMDFKKDALKMLDEMSGIETKNINETKQDIIEDNLETDIGSILENLDQEIDSIEVVNKNQTKKIVEDFKPKFLGKLYESPNPLEYPEGTMYKNTRNGVVYIKEGEAWEYLVEDGKPGAQGRAGAAGSGVGVNEVVDVVSKDVGITKNQYNILETSTAFSYKGIGKLQTTSLSNGMVGYKRISGKINNFTSAWASSPIASGGEGWEVLYALDAPFDAIQVVFPQTTEATSALPTSANIYVKATTSMSGTNGASGWSNATIVNISGVCNTRNDGTNVMGPKYAPIVSPWINVKSIEPVNGKYLIGVFIQFPATEYQKLHSLIDYGDTIGAFEYYKNKPDGNIIHCRKYFTVLGYPNTWWNDTAQFPILGLNVQYRKPVVNVCRWSDSKDEGSGATSAIRDGWVTSSLESMMKSNNNSVIYSDMNNCCPNADYLMIYRSCINYLTSGVNLPDILILPIWTVNGFPTDTSANASGILLAYGTLVQQTINLARKNKIRVILTSFAPNSTASKNLSATDVVRISRNTEWSDLIDIDVSALISGDVVNGQVQPLPGTCSDGIHYSDSTLAKLSQMLIPYLIP